MVDITRDIHQANSLGGSKGRQLLEAYADKVNNYQLASATSSTREAAIAIADTVLRGDMDDDPARMWLMGTSDQHLGSSRSPC